MNESELLIIAKEFLNKCEGSALTGSLMLFVRGINKRRESHDIDILVKSLDDLPIENMCQASPIYPDSVKFKIENTNITIDFLLNQDEEIETINGIDCGSVEKLLDKKYIYSRQDISPNSKNKHRLDLEFIGYDLESKDNEHDKNLIDSILGLY